MKLMIASDIHGSSLYCEKLLERYRESGCKKLLLLGDILYHGPRNDLPDIYNPKKVIELLNNMKEEILCVRGNCDTEVDQMVLQFPIMADYAVFYHNEHVIFATHGHHYTEQHPPMLYRGDVLLTGHTHVPACNVYDDFTYINPGSTTIPKSGSCHSYMIFDGGKFTWFNLESGESYKEFELK